VLEIQRDEVAKFTAPWWKFGMIRAGIVSLFYLCPKGHLNDLDPNNVNQNTGETKVSVRCDRYGQDGCTFDDRMHLVGWGGSVKVV
jgi:hypothetical protein